MPYISTKTNVSISKEKEQELKVLLGKAIENIPGKTERWLMLSFEDNCRLWFRGNADEPIAYIEVKLFGKAQPSAYKAMTEAICDIVEGELNVPSSNIYVKYEEVSTWGWNGGNF